MILVASPLDRVLPHTDTEALAALAQRLVRTPSYDRAHGYETGVARVLAETLAAAGLQPWEQPVDEGRANLLCVFPAGGTAPALILNGHMDTVPPPDRPPRLLGEVRDGRLWGRGSADMKGALAAMATALIAIRRAGVTLARPVLFAAVVAEETSSRAWRLGADLARDAWAVVGEPTSLALVSAHRGVDRYRVTVHGRAAHGATPALGVNAITRAARAIAAIEDEAAARWTRDRHPRLGSASFNIGTIHGGTTRNVVPDACAFELEKRYLPGDSPSRIHADLASFIATAIARADGREAAPAFSIERDAGCVAVPHDPLDTPIDHPFVACAAGAVDRVTGRDARFASFPAFTDAAVLQALGATAVVLGPGDLAVAHTDHESIDLSEITAAARIYAAITLAACGTGSFD